MMGTPVEWRTLSTIEPTRRWNSTSFYSSFSDVEGVLGLSGGHFRDFVAIKKSPWIDAILEYLVSVTLEMPVQLNVLHFFFSDVASFFAVFLKATFFLDHCSQESLFTHWVFRLLKCPNVKSQPCFLIMSTCFLVESTWTSWFWAQPFVPPHWNPARSTQESYNLYIRLSP